MQQFDLHGSTPEDLLAQKGIDVYADELGLLEPRQWCAACL